MTWRELTAEKLHDLRNALLIDVRSPCEHAAENIPGSVNVPLLDDTERAHVGTVYAQEGEIVARRLALRIISPKIPAIVELILALRKPGQSIVIHCWRGGLRSESVASFLAIVGIDCWRLTGGYKAWRGMVLNQFQSDTYGFDSVVLHGQTGAGKTEVLHELAAQGAQVIDLECLANHRGSVFGGLGLKEQPTQKNFEGQMWSNLRSLGEETVFLEGEGRKIGKLSLPDFMLKRVQQGTPVLITGSLETRVERIVRDYAGQFSMSGDVMQEGLAQLSMLRERLGARRVEELKDLILSRDIESAVGILLTEYYDPLYEKEIRQKAPYPLTVSGDNPALAATAILQWCKARASATSMF